MKQGDILSNVMWRFLQLRGYIDDKHELTAWGKCLDQALSVVDPSNDLEDAVFIAIEMMRMDLLNTTNWFSHVSGGPMRGSGMTVPHRRALAITKLIMTCRGGQDLQYADLSRRLYRQIATQSHWIFWSVESSAPVLPLLDLRSAFCIEEPD